MLKIISYNLNGIRSAITKGFCDWVAAGGYDIIGIQETKAEKSQVDISALTALGYHDYWFSATSKKGYSGVAIFSKQKADFVQYGFGNDFFDAEGRVIRADFGDLTVFNCYFPSGTSGEVRQGAKYEFLDAIFPYIMEVKKTRPNILLQGDFNIAHDNIDIHDPKSNSKTTGFLPEERAWLSKWLSEGGFVDSFRHANPELKKYSWWNVRTNSRATNKGWRIDYQTVTEPLKSKIVGSNLLNDAVHSDHCPCYLELDL